jgi:single-stranded-DNA-specific exonuclease
MPKRWIIRPPAADQAETLARGLGVHPLVAWVMLNRGLTDLEAGARFLKPSLDQLRPDALPPDTGKVVDRLAQALDQGETIGIHGDYDVDGVAGAALFASFLSELGGRVVTHLPHRQREGYGMKPAGVDALQAQGASLILTVDCGISDQAALEHAQTLGLPVIVVDHHQVPHQLPPAFAIINPNLSFGARLTPGANDDSLTNLSGAGLAYLVLVALRAHLRERGFFQNRAEPNLRSYLDLAALGTIADVVPLLGLNRTLVAFGLEQINAPVRPGLQMLSRVAGLHETQLSAMRVAFTLVPRLNAPGRLDHAGLALQLLLTRELREARELAEQLDRMNSTRQRVEERILAEAVEQVEEDPKMPAGRSLVAAGKGWHPGVIGIVASRLVDRYHRPTAVISLQDGVGKGSLRSVPGFHLYQALEECAPVLIGFGGHAQAAGLVIAEDQLPAFRERFEAVAAERTAAADREAKLVLDAEWRLSKLDRKLVDDLARLEPHGPGNPEPLFAARGVIVVQSRVVKDKHLFFVLQEGGVNIEAWAFGQGPECPAPGDLMDVAYTPELHRHRDRESIRIRIKDFDHVHSRKEGHHAQDHRR